MWNKLESHKNRTGSLRNLADLWNVVKEQLE